MLFRTLGEGNEGKQQYHSARLQERKTPEGFRDQHRRIPQETILERSPRKMVDFQESLLPSSEMVHTNVQEIRQRWHKACTDEGRASG